MISQNKQKGFTIVELLIVIVVIAILAAISIVAYGNVTTKSRDSQTAADAQSIAKAVQAYNQENNTWPTTGTQLTSGNAAIKINDSLAAKVQAGAPTATNQFRLTPCPTTGTQTGVSVDYYKVEGSAGVQSIKVGAGC